MANFTGFFGEPSELQVESNLVRVEESVIEKPLQDILTAYAKDSYTVIAHLQHTLLIGTYENGAFTFAKGETIEEKYLVQLRLFNEQEEILCVKEKDSYHVRHIVEGDGQHRDYVDSKSPFIGKRMEDASLAPGFVKLYEEGRKMTLLLPTTEQESRYALVTRSYINKDERTGQAGYQYSRYVDIIGLSQAE